MLRENKREYRRIEVATTSGKREKRKAEVIRTSGRTRFRIRWMGCRITFSEGQMEKGVVPETSLLVNLQIRRSRKKKEEIEKKEAERKAYIELMKQAYESAASDYEDDM